LTILGEDGSEALDAPLFGDPQVEAAMNDGLTAARRPKAVAAGGGKGR
jgi:hypothetical protein